MMKEKIIKALREGRRFSFIATPELMREINQDFKYDTTHRVNNYHRVLKSFHLAKYGRELVGGGDFGNPGDRHKHIVGFEYFAFCVSGEKLRQYDYEHVTKLITVQGH